MWRWMKLITLALTGAILLALVTGAIYQQLATARDLAGSPPPGELVDIGEHRLHIWCVGSGSPTVVLDSGLGGTVADWAYVQPSVAEFVRVCSYDRACVGYSDPSSEPRTSGQIANELYELLVEGDIALPVVLVGASYGGFNVRLLAAEHPAVAAGLVLVDASHEETPERLAAAGAPRNTPAYARLVPLIIPFGILRLLGVPSGLPASVLPDEVRPYVHAVRFRTSAYRAAADELLNMDERMRQVRESRQQTTIPLVVVSAGLVAGDSKLAEVRRQMQRDHVKLSSRSCHLIAQESGHVVWLDQPQIIVDAIKAVLEAVEGPTGDLTC